ncbi:RHS repeat-associated core domain-containing protein [Streptomyces sp. NPDC048266]|uniref:RHS repeat-associated core domain-containing protein n=1 Tax=Streptomyces sp. NPDC048266 TaxID=3155787 RepID=UPI0033E08C4C
MQQLLVLLAVLSVAGGLLHPAMRAGLTAAGDAAPADLPVPVAAAQATQSGYLPGGVSVSSSGEAVSDVPLDVPSGPGGMKPSLSLHYGSRGGNGVLGVGWSVAGASSITRCGRSVSSGDRQTGVHFRGTGSPQGDADRYCLGGQQLVNISGLYGASDAEYRTETESFTKIVSRDSVGQTPGWFQVWTRDGLKKEYRPKTVPRVAATATAMNKYSADVTLLWVLDKEIDRAGNVIEYSYGTTQYTYPDSGAARSTEILLDKISYSTADGSERRRFVKFNYDKRKDTSFTWVAGARAEQKQILTSIEMWAPNPVSTEMLWRYRFEYDQGSTKRSRLTSVRKCGSLGGCTLKRTFKYSSDASSFWSNPIIGPVQWTGAPGDAPPAMQSGDVNGDGADDFIFALDNEDFEGFPDDGGSREMISLSGPGTDGKIKPNAEHYVLEGAGDYGGGRNLAMSRLVDADSDGVADLYVTNRTSDRPELLHWDDATHSFKRGGSADRDMAIDTLGGRTVDFGDFNGDGRIDFLQAANDAGVSPFNLYLAQVGGGFATTGIPTNVEQKNTTLVDVDGDGRVELLQGQSSAEHPFAGKIFGLRDDGTPYTEDVNGRYPLRGYESAGRLIGDEVHYGDINGDGLQDAIVADWDGIHGVSDTDASDPAFYVKYNTGNGFGPEELYTRIPHWYTASGEWADNGLRVADMDSDGRSDLVIFHPKIVSGTSMPVSWLGGSEDFFGTTILNANRTYQNIKNSANPVWYEWHQSQVGDFNGDGRTDLMVSKGGDAAGVGGSLVVYENRPDDGAESGVSAIGQGQDLLIGVSDSPDDAAQATKWQQQEISYSTDWADGPRSDVIRPKTEFPAVNVRSHGMMIARKIVSRTTLADPVAADINSKAHTTEYAFENPIRDLQGRGFLGFQQMRTWEPQRPAETVTNYNNYEAVQDPDHPERHWYPRAGLPVSTRTTVGVMSPGDAAERPVKASTTRVTYTDYDYETVSLNSGLTHLVRPKSATLPDSSNARTYEWDESADLDWNLTAAGNLWPRAHFYNLQPATGEGSSHHRLTKTASQADVWGNITRSETLIEGKDSSEDGGISRTVTNYDLSTARVAEWLIGLPQRETTTVSEVKTAPASDKTVTNTVDYTFNAQGRPIKEEINRDATDPDLKITTSTGYGASGEVTWVKKETATPGVPVRQTNYDYTPLTVENSAGATFTLPDEKIYATHIWATHNVEATRPSTWILTHPGTGLVYRSVDSNGAQVSNAYDDLGRVVEQSATGATLPIKTAYAPRTDSYGGVNGTKVTVTRATAAGVTPVVNEKSETYTGAAGQTLTTVGQGLDGTSITTDTQYDVFGRAVAQSRPYFPGTTRQWTKTLFDSLDRPLKTTQPDLTIDQLDYPTPFKTVHTDADNHVASTVVDLRGRTITSATTPASGTDVNVTFTQGPVGVLSVSDPKNTTTNIYDRLGRLTQSTDANTGTMDYKYTGFGEKRWQKHAGTGERQETTFDDLGRVTEIADYTGAATTPHHRATTVWDTAANGIGQPHTVTSADGVIKTYAYDNAGRSTGTTMQEPASGPSYTTNNTYDSATGRLATVAYPAVAGRSDRFTAKYAYTPYGQLSQVLDASTTTERQLWKTNTLTADGTLKNGTYGTNALTTVRDYYDQTGRLKKVTDTNSTGTKITETGYEYTLNGSLKRRQDLARDRDESFTYDHLARLDTWTLNPPGTGTDQVTTYGYNTAGDLKTVDTRVGTTTSTQTNFYDNTSHPNAISKKTVTGGSPTDYTYDSQGRQTGGDGRTISYTNRGLALTPRSITKAGVTWDYLYDADGRRFKKSTGTGTSAQSTIYVGDLYEKRTTGSTVAHVFHVGGPTGHLAQVTYTGATDRKVEYTLSDPQGTASTITNDTGTSPQHQYFDPYGARTTPAGTTPAPTAPTGITRGYTGHNMDDETGLINMNGRLYDPIAKRVTTPDPHITKPSNPQNWNPYSYVNNNPTNATDPTGYDVLGRNNATPSINSNYGGYDTTSASTDSISTLTPEQLARTNIDAALSAADRIQTITETNQRATQNEITNPLALKAAKIAIVLFCGKECGTANAPTSEQEAAKAPRSLTATQHLANAYKTATYLIPKPKTPATAAGKGMESDLEESPSGRYDEERKRWKSEDHKGWGNPGPQDEDYVNTVNVFGGTRNCQCTAAAGDAELKGRPSSALNVTGGKMLGVGSLSDYYEADWSDVKHDVYVVYDELEEAGPGATAIIFGYENGSSHVFNAMVDEDGKTQIYDFQIREGGKMTMGEQDAYPYQYKHFRYLNTTGK